ncbi:MAG: UDP-2,3-diacylglucosamine diphosphatase [Muribaculaceae bacterium]|nr:UDP-2,3-diacylglucosamine diphosphatase [Muribaculaceae bacterium]
MRAYFLSDLHLGAPYFKDNKAAERRVVSFLDSIKDKADAIFLLGDILDYWYEYRYVVPRGFVRFFGKLAELSDRGIRIVWFIGNHDIWIFDYLPTELGIEVVDGYKVEEIDGHKFFMTHGDGVGKLKFSFKVIRGLFRSKICQKLFSGIHPRWTVPFAYRWSDHSRNESPLPSREDADRMMANIGSFSRQYLHDHPDIDYFLYGHLHLLERFTIEVEDGKGEKWVKAENNNGENKEKAEVIVLGEWLSKFSYAVWDGDSLEIKRYLE